MRDPSRIPPIAPRAPKAGFRRPPTDEGIRAARAAVTMDKIPVAKCNQCLAEVELMSDRHGHVQEWDYVRGVNPGFVLHRCRR